MTTPLQNLKHIFVLMLENRSFDHMLGFSGITGTDSISGSPTAINGLKGNEFNTYNDLVYPVGKMADWVIETDPGHEFEDTLMQLCGPNAQYQGRLPYPPINCSGFVANYAKQKGVKSPEQIMMSLAKEFAVCDNWFSSMPGPTWPNRFFVHAGSSGGLDHSPSKMDILNWDFFGSFPFPKGK